MEPTTAAYLEMNQLVKQGNATEEELRQAQQRIDDAEAVAINQEIQDDAFYGDY